MHSAQVTVFAKKLWEVEIGHWYSLSMVLHTHADKRNPLKNYFPEGMVRTFTHEEPSSFETLGSQFSISWKPIRTFVFVSGGSLVRSKVRVLWDRKSGSRPMRVPKMPPGFSHYPEWLIPQLPFGISMSYSWIYQFKQWGESSAVSVKRNTHLIPNLFVAPKGKGTLSSHGWLCNYIIYYEQRIFYDEIKYPLFMWIFAPPPSLGPQIIGIIYAFLLTQTVQFKWTNPDGFFSLRGRKCDA